MTQGKAEILAMCLNAFAPDATLWAARPVERNGQWLVPLMALGKPGVTLVADQEAVAAFFRAWTHMKELHERTSQGSPNPPPAPSEKG